MVENDVVLEVAAKLRAMPHTSREIADKAGVEESWLRMFRRGKIANPGVRQFRKIEAYVLLNEGVPTSGER